MRARTTPLSLYISDRSSSGFSFNQILDLSLVIRCRELSFDSQGRGSAVLPFLEDLPLLEYLDLNAYTWSVAERLLNVVETSSPLLWSLTMRATHTSHPQLERFPSLLSRIRRLDIKLPVSVRFTDGLVTGLQNLTELILRVSMEVPPLPFPKLVSLTIWSTIIKLVGNEIMEFPILDSLTLHGDWSILPLIVAPKLTKLILQGEDLFPEMRSILLRATVRPISFILSYIPQAIDLPRLLAMWSGLLELHLEYFDAAYTKIQNSLATLHGNSHYGLLCPNLRYFTVHVNQGQRDPTVRNQTLHTIVEERKRHGIDELRRVMCVWENWDAFDTRPAPGSKETEWVDIL